MANLHLEFDIETPVDPKKLLAALDDIVNSEFCPERVVEFYCNSHGNVTVHFTDREF